MYTELSDTKEISVKIGDQHVHVSLELIEKSGRSKTKQARSRDRLQLTVVEHGAQKIKINGFGKTALIISWSQCLETR